MGFDEGTTALLRSADASAAVLSPSVRIVITGGPDKGQDRLITDLAHRRLLVGKGELAELRLTDPTVSRRHLALELDESGGVVLTDLGSSNGTFVGNLRIREATLTGTETVRLGATLMQIALEGAAGPVSASTSANFGAVIGGSPPMRRMYSEAERLAPLDIPLLLEGEAGTGKALLAEAIHEASARRGGPLLVFDRGEMPATALERELFGSDDRGPEPGLLERARGGTLVITEISALDLPTQLRLLRALETKSVRRIGGSSSQAIDVRLIATTRRDLDRAVQERAFREEFLLALSAGRIEVPPLRKRRGDLPLLAKFFWLRFGGNAPTLSPDFLQRLDQHSLRGNVRQLAALVAEELAGGRADGATAAPDASDGADADSESAKDILDAIVQKGLAFAPARQLMNAEFERRYLKHMLALHKGNVSRAAAASGISRRYFYRLQAKDA